MRKLERKYGNELAVVGVHSAKFDAERATESVQNAVRRYRIEHPVINDSGFAVWQSFAVRAWPTLMFLDPRGRVIGKHEGEFDLDTLDGVIGQMIDRSAGMVTDRPPVASEIERGRVRHGVDWRPVEGPAQTIGTKSVQEDDHRPGARNGHGVNWDFSLNVINITSATGRFAKRRFSSYTTPVP